MNKGSATNIFAILAVVALVAGAAWFKSQRTETPTEKMAQSTQPVQVVTAEVVTTTAEKPVQAAAAETLPRLVDLGADKCKACKTLAPILDALREEYQNRLRVDFIDVWKNPSAQRPYSIRLIPTQILFDKDGNEVWRHEGFISKEDLKAIFAEKVGVK